MTLGSKLPLGASGRNITVIEERASGRSFQTITGSVSSGSSMEGGDHPRGRSVSVPPRRKTASPPPGYGGRE